MINEEHEELNSELIERILELDEYQKKLNNLMKGNASKEEIEAVKQKIYSITWDFKKITKSIEKQGKPWQE